MRGETRCKTGVRRITEIVRDELKAAELDTFFDISRKNIKDEDFFTFVATFDMDSYSSADVAA